MPLNKVEIPGVNTAKLPVLTNAKMRELFTALQAGDIASRDQLINGNLRLVLSVIQRFQNRGEHSDDLFQVGCIGLMKAIDNFDLGQNVKFSTYAVPMIIGEIRRYLRDNNPIRVSRSLRDIAYKALQVRDGLVHRFSKEPTISEIAEELAVPREDVLYALDAIQEPMSLFEPIYHTRLRRSPSRPVVAPQARYPANRHGECLPSDRKRLLEKWGHSPQTPYLK